MFREPLWTIYRTTPRVGKIARISIENLERINNRLGNVPLRTELEVLDTKRIPYTMC